MDMKYKSFNLTNFIGLKYFSPESIAELKGENEKYKQSKKSKTLNRTQTKVATMQVRCAKCKKNCSKKPENYVYSYSMKKKDYKKFFLCENCSMKCRKCSNISKTGIFVYIWNKSKSDYNKLFYCMDCYKKANLKQCAKCKKRVDSKIVVGGKPYCGVCYKTKNIIENEIKVKPKDNTKILVNKIKEFKFVEPKKVGKENADVILAAKKLKENISINKFKESEDIYNCATNLENFFKVARSKLENSDPVAEPLDTIIKLLNVPKNVDLTKATIPPDVVSKVTYSVKKIRDEILKTKR